MESDLSRFCSLEQLDVAVGKGMEMISGTKISGLATFRFYCPLSILGLLNKWQHKGNWIGNHKMNGPTILILASLLTAINGQMTCDQCRSPKFQGSPLYLPFCWDGVTYNNACEALCAAESSDSKPIQNSCDSCEVRKCKSRPFAPVCAADQDLAFPNACYAKCANIDVVDCSFPVASVIPGKSKLPVGYQPGPALQSLGNWWQFKENGGEYCQMLKYKSDLL